ncbi:MAG: hypothetical protein HOP08_02710 [Cyclobacteriaceae bacterium]|nr:hypothetical protein [Cyclobacteriaceae bacterium]
MILLRILVIIAVFTSFSANAQRQKKPVKQRIGSSIVDDSTKNVYGPQTTLWTTEKDLFENRPNYRVLDTAVNNYHRWTYVQRFNNFYKDLGPMGTALSSIFPQVPGISGAISGFTAYEPYYNSEEPHYFNTKSPYTRMYVVWGGNGRAMTRVEFSRNINPRWNVGFNYRPILVEKQIQRRRNGDYQTISHYYDFYTTYKSKNDRYALLFNYRRIRHRVNENGGVYNPSDTLKNYFDTNARPILVAAQSEEYRRNIHLSHQYQLAEPFQIYHIADFSIQSNAYSDLKVSDPNSLYDNIEVDADSVKDRTTFASMQQEVGIKGNAGKLFYSAHYRFRNYDYSNWYLDPYGNHIKGTENYLGGTMSLRFDSLSVISGSADYMLEGYYRLEGEIQTPWIEGSFKTSLSKPSLMQTIYRGSKDLWSNSFDKVNSTEAKGYLKWNSSDLQLWVGTTFTVFNNYIYFKQATPIDTTVSKQTVLPYQSSGTQSTFSPEVKASFRFFRNMFIRPQFVYTRMLANDQNVFQIPELFMNVQLAYENHLFKRHLQIQVGTDFHWKSSYQALGYDPAIQTFYVQRDGAKLVPAFPLVDVFFTGKMRRGRFFFKYHNLVQAITKVGYLPTPGYPGQGSIIDFGFDFLLFD